MREVVKQFPDDLDAATLFAESGMNLHPWGLWMVDGTPREGTEEIVATLESVIKRDPNHLGAIHYYIHSVEASKSPERALAAANRLAAMAPAAGHIVHMPAHVYIRTGDYAAAVKTNQEAAAVDQAYIKASGAQGIYPLMYYSHNLHFIAMCSAMNGDYAEANKNADLLAAHVAPHVKDMPPLEGFMTIPIAVMTYVNPVLSFGVDTFARDAAAFAVRCGQLCTPSLMEPLAKVARALETYADQLKAAA